MTKSIAFLILLGSVVGCVSYDLALDDVIAPVGNFTDREAECLMRYASTITKLKNRDCYNRCMKGETQSDDCINLNVEAFEPNVEFPCHTQFVPYFVTKKVTDLHQDHEIDRVVARSPVECQMKCQERYGCNWWLYYNLRQPLHKTNCELLLRFEPLYGNDLVYARRKIDKVFGELMCINCKNLDPANYKRACGRYHPYVVNGKPFCSDVHSIFTKPVSTDPKLGCHIQRPDKYEWKWAHWRLDTSSDYVGADDIDNLYEQSRWNKNSTDEGDLGDNSSETAQLIKEIITDEDPKTNNDNNQTQVFNEGNDKVVATILGMLKKVVGNHTSDERPCTDAKNCRLRARVTVY